MLTPAPSGTLQADVYRPLRIPAVLLGDSRLGGVSATLAAYEALFQRGYDIPAVVMFEQDGVLENQVSVQRHVAGGTDVFLAPQIPPMEVPLKEYFADADVTKFFEGLISHLNRVDHERFERLAKMGQKAKDVFWYPFTQHTQLDKVTCIDSAHGERFTCYNNERGLHSMVDGIGSWWTNGVGHGNIHVSKAIANASARYGHVMFPEAAYEPAFQLAEKLLQGPGKNWASRVFYSDDGSTAVEVALKMAFRKRRSDFPDRKNMPVNIVGLEGSYHGDTLGVMKCAQDSDYNRMQTPWYEPRGVFFDPPIASIKNGVWTISMPPWLETNYDVTLNGRDELFDDKRNYQNYDEMIARRLDEVLGKGEIELGALVIEPVMLGAGGMKVVDPAFQRSLVHQCRLRGIPVVFDEVFSGLWRLGAESAAELIGCDPDIATYGKLLTGGTVPLAMTLATEEVFQAFDGPSKREALLHGHSYSAHAIGCAAGVESLRQYERFSSDAQAGRIREYWSEAYGKELSAFSNVQSVTVLGTVVSVELKSAESGYAAAGAVDAANRLKEEGVFARPLGNVIYLMCSPVAEREVCDETMQTLLKVLEPEELVQEEAKTEDDSEDDRMIVNIDEDTMKKQVEETEKIIRGKG